jgi:choline dehydrogenase-like flavoprotein
MPTTFDFIIVGAGSAGCVLANRLIHSGGYSVALIEAGGSDQHPAIQIPFGLSLLSRFTSKNWGYDTQPQAACGERSLFWPRGKVLGGSSSVNAMCYIRGDWQDYDEWAELTDEPAWSAKHMQSHFIRQECNTRGASAFHGGSGELSVSDLRHKDGLSKAWLDAAQAMGFPANPDFNGQTRYGVGEYQVTQRAGARCSSAKAFLSSLRNNPRFTLFSQSQVDKIVCENGSVRGVMLTQNGSSYKKINRVLHAKREVLICAGAINSPQLLMLSGIGDPDHLHAHGIELVTALPGVGQNLQDHLDVIVQRRASRACGYSVLPGQWGQYAKGAWDYLRRRSGVFSSNVAEVGGFVHSRHGTAARPDIQLHFIPAILRDHGRQLAFEYGFGVHACNLYPQSRGQITLADANPSSAPLIQPRYLSASRDMEVMQDALDIAQQIMQQAPLQAWGATPLEPAQDTLSDAEQSVFIRAQAETIYHPVGTCKMGKPDDPMAVVDPQLNVYGVKNLRVVDASIMPTIVGGNTNAPTMAIAEQAAEFILAT